MAREYPVNTLVFFPSQTSRTQASSFLSHSETPTPGCKKAFHRSEILRDPSRHLFNLSRTLCLTISTFLNPILTSAPQASRSSHPAQSHLKSQVEESRLELELLQPVGEVVLSPTRMMHLKSNPIYVYQTES